MNRLDEAKAALDKALELEPGSAPGLFTLSKYYARIGSDEMAAEALARSIRFGGSDRLADALDDEDLREVAERLSLEEGGASKRGAEYDLRRDSRPIEEMKMESRIEA
jgi:tetratricopeptide (TPR) repeat protein